LINSLTPSSNKIIFEYSDMKNDIGLMITSTTTTKNNTTNDDNDNNNNFQLHLYDGYNDIALVMNMNIRYFANMCHALGPYFQRSQIEI
jgi:hypothetical protein